MKPQLATRELLARLISFESVSSAGNLPIAEFLCEYLDRPGVRIEREPSADGSKVNLVISAGPMPRDRSGLILSGHLDVVPADEPDWKSGPFELTERGGAYYGRGAADMKGFIALAANLLVERSTARLEHPLVLLLTCDEELGSLGAQHLASGWPADRPLPCNAIIGEPTLLRVVRMHKGHLKVRITVRGKPAHSGSPHLGVNAIEPGARVITALAALRAALASERADTSRFFESVPFAVLNVARVQGGEAVNVIPAACAIDVGLRLLPGSDSAGAVERVRQAVFRTLPEPDSAARSAARATVDLVNDNPPLLTDEASHVCRALCAATGQTETIGVSFASDGGVLKRELGIDCVLFGPGSIEVAHRANEFVPIDELNRAERTLTDVISRLCGPT